MFPILLIALFGLGVWGYREHQDKNSVLIKAENQYQRAFHDLSFHMDKLHRELGNTLAINEDSDDFYKKGLINVWRITSQAQNEINQLPLTLLPFNKTEQFLANLSNFAYQTSIRDLGKNPLSDGERASLKELYDHSGQISNDLRDVQSKVLANNLRWMDVETAVATENTKLDNTIIDGFKAVDKKVSEYPEIDWGAAAAAMPRMQSFQALAGGEANVDEIRQKAEQFLDIEDSSGFKIVESGSGTEYDSFAVSGVNPNTGQNVHLDYSKKGGQLIWYLANKDVKDKVLDMRGARDAALQFLESRGYSNMVPISYDEFQNVASLTMAPKQGDIIIFPAKLSINVALDDGEVTGLQMSNFVHENHPRQLGSPKMSMEQAKASLNSAFKIDRNALVLINDDMNAEVLCYEFLGAVNNGRYRIFINADNGEEVKVETLRDQDEQVFPQT
jgi:spore germination protein